jgi:hypothetical protein
MLPDLNSHDRMNLHAGPMIVNLRAPAEHNEFSIYREQHAHIRHFVGHSAMKLNAPTVGDKKGK